LIKHNSMNKLTWILKTGLILSPSPLPVAYVFDGVTMLIVYVTQGPHYNTLHYLPTPSTWHLIDIAY
jgi:hypothetical protein